MTHRTVAFKCQHATYPMDEKAADHKVSKCLGKWLQGRPQGTGALA